MFDDLYPEQAAAAVDARVRRPADPAPVPARFSLWGTTTAAPRGVAAGAAEAAGSTSDLLGGFGSVLGAMPGSGRGMFSAGTPEERKQINDARTKLLKDGPDYMSEGGRSFRNVAQDYAPDPATAHMAEQTVFNLFRVGSKALTAAAVGGNVPGAVVAGLEEGFTQSDQLARLGVDVETRTKVGAVTAVTNAVGFALPVAGKTWAQTVGLALAGGPASFVAQNALTREILQEADYTRLADQYDPFDPVGLALSTVLPLGFGALAMRGARGADAGRQVPDVPPVADDAVDAARVALVRQQVDAANPVPDNIDAVAAHDAAHTAALEQITAGQRVEVVTPDDVAAKAADAMAARIEQAGDPMPMPVARPAPEAAPARADLPQFDYTATARQAADLLNTGESAAQIVGRAQASGQPLAPELQNMLVGLSEFGGRPADLLAQIDALKAKAGDTAPMDVIANAVERMRAGQGPDVPQAAANPLEARLQELEGGNPTALDSSIAVEFGDDGKPTRSVTLREYLDTVKAEAAQEAADANLLQVAANCFLTNGA